MQSWRDIEATQAPPALPSRARHCRVHGCLPRHATRCNSPNTAIVAQLGAIHERKQHTAGGARRTGGAGTGLKEFASRGVPWIIEAAGFDYCAIDHEHGAFDMETIANLASWFQATNVSPIVRLHKSFAHLIPGILDQGIMGIQVSEVETAEEARAIVRLAKYPPIGNRGISGQGPHTGYKSYGARHATEYAPWANENIIIFPRSSCSKAWRMSRRLPRSRAST